MPEHCCALWPTGEPCTRPGVVVDEARGGWVCHVHAPPGPTQRWAIRRTVRKAMLHPERYLQRFAPW